MDKKLDMQEKILGGIFGLIAIVAAIVEMCINGINAASIAGMVKDVAGTLIVVVLLITVIKSLMPKKQSQSFEERLENALNEWQQENSNMIVKKDNSGGNSKYGLSMKTNVSDFYSQISTTKNAGWFVRLPLIDEKNYSAGDIEMQFHLNEGTFFDGMGLKGEMLNNAFNNLNKMFTQLINQKYSGDVKAGGKDDNITVIIEKPISEDEDIKLLIDIINTMYQAFLVSANMVTKV